MRLDDLPKSVLEQAYRYAFELIRRYVSHLETEGASEDVWKDAVELAQKHLGVES